jgi:sec-independent protein translocase protein TatB
MFDIGFMELLLIGIVALLVLGPDKLPGAIRTGALWLGRARRSFNKVKTEIEQQLNTDEIRRQLQNESFLADI